MVATSSIHLAALSNSDGLANVIAEVAELLPKIAGIKHNNVVDTNFIEARDKSGFIDALYEKSNLGRLADTECDQADAGDQYQAGDER